jgi:hypothetical protein
VVLAGARELMREALDLDEFIRMSGSGRHWRELCRLREVETNVIVMLATEGRHPKVREEAIAKLRELTGRPASETP